MLLIILIIKCSNNYVININEVYVNINIYKESWNFPEKIH